MFQWSVPIAEKWTCSLHITGTGQYRAGESGRETPSIRKCAMNQRNKRGKAKGHFLQWFVVV